jgi:DNA-binding transcriptional LysR family regulator
VECKVGIGVVPETTARRATASMEVKVVELSDGWAARDLKICVRDLQRLPPYVRQLVDHLRATT